MSNVGYATLQIIPSAKGMLGNLKSEFADELDDAGDKAGKSSAKRFGSAFGSTMKTVAKAGALAFAAGVGAAAVFGKAAIGAASDLDESMSKVSVVFGTAAGSVVDWSKTSASALGSSQQQALEAAGTYGNLLKAFGLNDDAAQGMSISMVELASDLASFNNTSVPEALEALQSGISGETEPLKKYGVAINDVRLKEEALALGLIKSTKDALSPAAKAQASYSLIMKDTALAQGDFARTSDGLANKQKIMAARFDDVKAKIGQALLPAMSAVVGFISDKVIPGIQSLAEAWMPKLTAAFQAVKSWVEANWPAIRDVIVSVFDAIVTKAGQLWNWLSGNVFPGIIAAAQEVAGWFERNWPTIQTVIEAVLTAVGTAITFIFQEVLPRLVDAFTTVVRFVRDDLIPALVDAYGWFRDNIIPVVRDVASWLVGAFKTALDVATTAFGYVSSAVSTLWGWLETLWDRSEGLRGFLAGAFKLAWDAVTTAVALLWAAIELAWSWVQKLWDRSEPFRAFLAGAFKLAWETAATAIDLVWGAVQTVWDKTEGLRGFLVGAFKTGMEAAGAIWEGFKGIIDTIAGAIQSVIDKAQGAITKLKELKDGKTLDLSGAVAFGLSLKPGDLGFQKEHSGGLIRGYQSEEQIRILQAGETVLTKQQASGRFMNFDQPAASQQRGPLFGDVYVSNDVDADGLFQRARFAMEVPG